MYEKLSSNLLVLEKTLRLPVELVRATIMPFQVQAQEKNISLVILENTRELTVMLSTVVFNVDEKKVPIVLTL
jgi:hypothetical protein